MVSAEQSDHISLTIALKACSRLQALEFGKMIHGSIKKNDKFDSNMYVASALIDLYSKCGLVGDALRVFEEHSRPDVVLWTTIITGYEQNGYPIEALLIFTRMVVTGHVSPDPVTLVSVVSACVQLLDLKAGRSVHGYVTRKGFDCGLSLRLLLYPVVSHGWYSCGVSLPTPAEAAAIELCWAQPTHTTSIVVISDSDVKNQLRYEDASVLGKTCCGRRMMAMAKAKAEIFSLKAMAAAPDSSPNPYSCLRLALQFSPNFGCLSVKEKRHNRRKRLVSAAPQAAITGIFYAAWELIKCLTASLAQQSATLLSIKKTSLCSKISFLISMVYFHSAVYGKLNTE
ncbi:hypothetical protein RJ639_035711 [Escallonia herrerae]|uniref:Pentatricopeptide repeat-containing protein n=1 Tax=Escallonia herrerae TaxID=1293975 RepID=A0AA88WZ33_9ASTE|nr:hypothetical protein RJ639_035711 [Escallonia herrerae]